MVEPSSVIFSTIQTDPANPSAELEGQAARQRKKKGSLAVELDPLLGSAACSRSAWSSERFGKLRMDARKRTVH